METERLSFAVHRIEDFADSAAMWADPEVTRHIGGKPFTEEEVWARLLRYVGHWSLMGFGYWVIREKSSGRFVGEVGFADLKRDLAHPFHGTPEMGWALARWAHGQGFATEAVRAAVQWGSQHFGARRTVCLIDPENLPSIGVARKCGYQQVQPTTYKGHPTLIFERAP